MDIQLVRTFQEVSRTGSFQLASERLFVTQSAVSLRIKRLEGELGQPLFARSKAGAVLTPAGERFARFAAAMLRVWEGARHQVAVPDGFDDTLIIGAEHSLWPGLGLRWLKLLERMLPRTAFRTEMGSAERIGGLLADGLCDVALVYSPQVRPGLSVEAVSEDQLVLVATDPLFAGVADPGYVFVDWGPEFLTVHKTQFPDLALPRLSLGLGLGALDFVLDGRRGGYFPARAVEAEVAAGRLHLCDAPALPFPAFAVSRATQEAPATAEALRLLRLVAGKVEAEQAGLVDEAGLDTVDDLTAELGLAG